MCRSAGRVDLVITLCCWLFGHTTCHRCHSALRFLNRSAFAANALLAITLPGWRRLALRPLSYVFWCACKSSSSTHMLQLGVQGCRDWECRVVEESPCHDGTLATQEPPHGMPYLLVVACTLTNAITLANRDDELRSAVGFKHTLTVPLRQLS